MTAAQLAESLEVSTRTVYRDVTDLIASGVRISGEAGVGYQLSPDYRLPPLTFNAEEVEALAIGMRMVEAWGDTSLRQAARAIVEKVNAVVADPEQERMNNTALFSLRFGVQEQASQHLGTLRQAVNERRVIDFAYRDELEQSSARSARPLGLYFWGRVWTAAAWCELRSDFRSFRLDRMTELKLTARHFELVSPCTLDDYAAAVRQRGLRSR
jgi:predicted DNA-binding transcriptional regulator YafY